MLQPPRRLAIWDPQALDDRAGRLVLAALARPNFAWTGLQIRDRQRQTPPALLRQIASATRQRGLSLWINRHADWAESLGADGLVVGVESPKTALPLLISVHGLDDLPQADAHKALALIYGHVLATPSKPNQPPQGWLALRALTKKTALPVLALGGLTLADEAKALAHGAYGLAAIRSAFKEY